MKPCTANFNLLQITTLFQTIAPSPDTNTNLTLWTNNMMSSKLVIIWHSITNNIVYLMMIQFKNLFLKISQDMPYILVNCGPFCSLRIMTKLIVYRKKKKLVYLCSPFLCKYVYIYLLIWKLEKEQEIEWDLLRIHVCRFDAIFIREYTY